MKKILFVLLYFVYFLSSRTEAQQLLSTKDLREQVDLSGLELSPDGKQILVSVSRQDYDSNSFSTALVMIDVNSHEQRTFSQREGISMATWSPAGNRIAFLATVNDVDQIFTQSLQGGEAQQITNSKGGILYYSWSPDGKQFAFIATEDPVTKAGPERFNNSYEVGSND